METRRVIIDTDIGDDIDDALALNYALRRPELEILGVTTVWGDVNRRAAIAQALLRAAGRADIPVFAGCDLTLCNRVPRRGDILCANEPLPGVPPRKHAVDFLIDTLRASDGDITLLMLGALTNLAMALIKAPDIGAKIGRALWMGGSFTYHYLTWNALCDPEAARVVFEAGLPLDLVSRDEGLKTALTEEQTAMLCQGGDALNDFIARELRLYRARVGLPVLFDPLTVACLCEPEIARFEERRAVVETRGEFTRGLVFLINHRYDQSYAIEGFPPPERLPRVRVACGVDGADFVRRFTACLRGLPPVAACTETV